MFALLSANTLIKSSGLWEKTVPTRAAPSDFIRDLPKQYSPNNGTRGSDRQTTRAHTLCSSGPRGSISGRFIGSEPDSKELMPSMSHTGLNYSNSQTSSSSVASDRMSLRSLVKARSWVSRRKWQHQDRQHRRHGRHRSVPEQHAPCATCKLYNVLKAAWLTA